MDILTGATAKTACILLDYGDMKTNRLKTAFLLLLASFVLLVPGQSLAATEISLLQGPNTSQPEIAEQGFLLWQRLNEARAYPRATMTRLGISEATAKAALGEDAWILDTGLPPLAWNTRIQSAANDHGRDMLNKVYYSKVSPDGRNLEERLTAADYTPLIEEETLVALVFSNPVALDAALDVMFDNMLRDELNGTPGVVRNIFSPDFSEIGLALNAESVALLDGQPYVYLLVVDFSQPIEERGFVVGRIDPGTSLVLRSRETGFWYDVPVLPGNLFQFRLSGLGEDLFYWDTLTEDYVHTASTAGLPAWRNQAIDLRLPALAP